MSTSISERSAAAPPRKLPGAATSVAAIAIVAGIALLAFLNQLPAARAGKPAAPQGLAQAGSPPSPAAIAQAAEQAEAPAAATPTTAAAAQAAAAASAPAAGDPVALVQKLATQLQEQPDDIEGWQMLGRAYGAMGRDADAVQAYRRVLALSPPDAKSQAQAYADLGRAIGRANGRRLNAEAQSMLDKALKLDPGNVMAHALLGRVALERGEPAGAKKHWEQALANMDQSHPFAQQLRDAIQMASAAPATAPQGTKAGTP